MIVEEIEVRRSLVVGLGVAIRLLCYFGTWCRFFYVVGSRLRCVEFTRLFVNVNFLGMVFVRIFLRFCVFGF